MKNNKKEQKIKKPYTPPKVETKDIYEVNALGCAKCPSAGSESLTLDCIRGTKQTS